MQSERSDETVALTLDPRSCSLRRQLRPERVLAVGSGADVFEQHGEVGSDVAVARD